MTIVCYLHPFHCEDGHNSCLQIQQHFIWGCIAILLVKTTKNTPSISNCMSF
jgi:hypothetical protein